MPRLNGTGPQGDGPMTGRGLGNCSKANVGVSLSPRGRGLGMSRGRNCGRGLGFRGYSSTPELTPEQQKDILNQQKAFLENELTGINEQIEKL